MLWYGKQEESEWEVMELLGLSLLKHFESCEFSFSIKTVLMIADQLVEALEEMHSQGVIHMDIKPDNIVFGTGHNQDILYLIDFGISKIIEHRQRSETKSASFKGNVIWASVNLLRLHEGSQRDDLEAMMYTALFLLNGDLPWMRLPDSLMSYLSVLKCKERTSPAELFHGLPFLFEIFVYVRSLRFQEVPNYAYIRSTLRNYAQKSDIAFDFQYDWKIAAAESQSPDPSGASFDQSESVGKPKRKRKASPSNKPHKQVARLDAASPVRSPGALLEMCKNRGKMLEPEGEKTEFHLKLTPVVMGEDSILRAFDELRMDECQLDSTSTDTTPKSSSPVLRPSVRSEYRKLKEKRHLSLAE